MICKQILRATPSAPAPTLGKRAAWWWLCCASSSALLSLLVVGCFECFVFPVKRVEASWLLELVFLLFFQLQLLLWTRTLLFWVSKTYHLEACCLHFPTLGTILSAWGHPGGPWEQQEGHVGVRSKIFSDFWLDFGTAF